MQERIVVSEGPDETLALWLPAAGQAELRAEPLPPPAPGAVTVRMLYSGISRGTEALVFSGRVPDSERERMRGPHMGGSFAFPVKYGYCAVGEIEDGPRAGEKIACLHPHQARFAVPESEAIALPDGVPPGRAVLAANMETALNVVWDAAILPGDRVCVFGAGVVGALVAHIAAAIPGTELVLVDIDPRRQALADALGLAFSEADRLADSFDVLVNASASGAALTQAIDHAGMEARIVEASWYADRPVTLPLGGAFHARRLSLVASQVGALPPARRSRWDFSRRFAKALEFLRDDRLEALISGETAFGDLGRSYAGILTDPTTLCHRIVY
ncbi:MAG: zinc-binding alcohol dehydrogenase [Rhizobiales bacterium]|nr:zinc-binding alcohol dehydrogenase [Hyphomicrobiales bacterium]